MQTVSLVDAKTHLSRLIEQAAHGESVRIMRRGKIVAQISKVTPTRKPIDLKVLRALTDNMTLQAEPARKTIPNMRDEARY